MESLGAMGRDRKGGGAELVEYEMGFRNWRRSGGLNKGGLDESGDEGTKRRWPACWGGPTHRYWTA